MVVVTKQRLGEAAGTHKDAAKELGIILEAFKVARWQTFLQVREEFPSVDAVDGYIVFNVRRNRYRLITVVHYAKELEGRRTEGHIYIRSFLTHREYDDRAKWDPFVSA